MRTKTRVLLMGLAATVTMAFAVNSASANKLSTSSSTFSLIWQSLKFIPPSGESWRCGVTLSGSFHSQTIAKNVGSLIGHINHAALQACTGGRVTLLTATLPWHVTYRGFTGTLPIITSVSASVVGYAFRIENGLTCLAATSAANPMIDTITLSSGVAQNVRASGSIPLNEGLCGFAGNGSFEGTGTVSAVEGRSVPITVTLI